MIMSIPKKMLETVTGSLDEKRRYRAIQARVKRLPSDYRATVEALSRYLMVVEGVAKGDVLVAMLDDLTVLFEEAAADGTPIRTIVGAEPIDFATEFAQNYADGQWMEKERSKLITAIDKAAEPQHAPGSQPEGGDGA